MMNRVYSCTYFDHLNEPIQGYCLNIECNCPQKQFCLKCIQEENKHSNHKEDCKGFQEILDLVQNSITIFSNQQKSLEKSFQEVRAIYEQQIKELDSTKNKLAYFKQMLEEQNYEDLREQSNISLLRIWYSMSLSNQGGKGSSTKNEIIIQDSGFNIIKLLQSSFQQIKNQSTQYFNKFQMISESQNNDLQVTKLNQAKQLFEFGLQYMQEHEWDKADQMFSKSIEKNKNDYKTLFFQSWVLIEKNRCQEGLKLLEECQALNENLSIDLIKWCNIERNIAQNSVLTIAQGYALDMMDNQEKALLLYDQAISYDKRQTFAYARKGSLLVKFKIQDAALQSFQEGLQIAYNKAYLHYCQGITLLENEDLNQALISFKAAAQFDPNFSLNNYNIGNILRSQQKLDEALFYLDLAISQDPNLLKAYDSKCLVLCDMKKYDQALDFIEEALKKDPNYKQAFYLKGNCLKLQKKYKEAITQFDRALFFDSKFVFAYNLKGNCLLSLKQYKEAFQCYDQAIQIDNKCIQAYLNKGLLLKELKQSKEALKQFDLALLINPKCPQIYKNKGVVLEETKKLEEAAVCYQMAIEYGDPQSEEIKKWIGQIKVKKGLSWIFGN
ncbi:unnamed protein product [Paramecium sonneborni]|uniref:Tetratricopeptide repeat protein n=1 Tax=Paramecium sonneborni TaxID=65129 RepID=A0A8S1N033_9CILI|nr:unnamed protein product [Paramecium sonneborni]